MQVAPKPSRSAAGAAVVGALAFAWAFVMPLVAGANHPGYSHVRNYISELGQTGAPYADWVNWAGFFPIGLLVWLFLVLIRRSTPLQWKTLLLLSTLGGAYVLSAFFPCDPGCPCTGRISISQLIHNLTAVISYPAMIVGLFQAGRAFGQDTDWGSLAWPTFVCAIAGAVGFVLMLTPALDFCRGAFQLVVEATSFGWLATVGWMNVRIARRANSPGPQP